MKLLIVEDNPQMLSSLERAFTQRHMQVITCNDGAQALQVWTSNAPQVVVLDLSLPNQDGLEVLDAARAQGLHTPVLILTARGTVGDRILGLNTGADDYLAKPFDLDELEARVRALYRRGLSTSEHGHAADSAGNPSCGLLRLDERSGAVYCMDEVLALPPRELAMLSALLRKTGLAVSKERLFALVFPSEKEVQFEAIDVVAYRLRKKLPTTGAQLVTLRGLGYMLKAL